MNVNTWLKIAGASFIGILVLAALITFISPVAATMPGNMPNNMNSMNMNNMYQSPSTHMQHHNMGSMQQGGMMGGMM